jgi:16S rRNA (cytidine1402-2'-O)-methyltransferase
MTGRRPSKYSHRGVTGPAPNPDGDPDTKSAILQAIGRQLDKLCSSPLLPGLYIVSTPIGNLSDISIRALFTLATADVALCEDTRHSRKLISSYGIHRKLEAYHDFSGEKDRSRVLGALAEGKSVAIVSDAGTPLISDPGYKLVRDAISAGFGVYAVPGPSALLAALVTSGLPSDRFYFGGFLPPKDAARSAELERLRSQPGTLIFHETGGRLEAALETLEAVLPERPVAIARELTKLHESVLRGTAKELLGKIRRKPPLGEFVLLIGPGEEKAATPEDIEKALRTAMQRISLKDAVEEVSKGLGVGRKAVYNLALKVGEKKR